MKQFMLTTNNNPYDPFDDFDNWFQFDIENSYNSCERLMRIANLKDDNTEVEDNTEIERAIDEIVKNDFTDTYVKASKDYPDLEEDTQPITETS